MENQTNNLSTFRILFIVQGILTLLFSLFFVFYAFMGIFISNETAQSDTINPGAIFLSVGIVGFVITVIIGILTLVAAKFIKEQRNYKYILVTSILNVLTGVLGILLCVFTVIEINKPHVKALFEQE